MEQILSYIGYVFLFLGAIFLLLGAIGILRMPDIFARLQAGTKASTLGSLGMLLGVGFLRPEWFFKIIIIMIFVILSNPISSHAIARGSYLSGLKPKLDETEDAFEEAIENNEEKTKKEEE